MTAGRPARLPAWVRELQASARSAHDAAPLPDRVAHLWRYTDPATLVPSEDAAVVDAPPVVRAPAGVRVESLADAAAAREAEVRPLLGSLVPAGHGKFEALNAASWREGVSIRVPRGATIEEPVHVRLEAPSAGRSAPRLLAVLDEGSEATIVEEFAGGSDTPSWIHGVTEIFVGPGARLRYRRIERSAEGVRHHATLRVRLAAGASAQAAIVTVGGGIVKSDLGFVLDGEGAEAELSGVAFGHRRRHVDQHTRLHHAAPRTHSQLDWKVVLKDRARSAYTGLIRIERSAPFSDAYQENRNLLLSDGTRAESIPELEILTDEVACKHGATTGPVDDEPLFYLMSRGIPRPAAVRIVVEGFLEPTLAKLPEAVAEVVRQELAERL